MRTMILSLALAFAFAWAGCGDKNNGNDNGSDTLPAEDTLGSADTCAVDCDGKQCGDDGCGGSCGECDGDANCILGACVVPDPVCGDELCEAPETPEDCPEDCTESGPVCGDELCTPPENPDTCPDDCPPGPICGDGECVPPETLATCPDDCEDHVEPTGCTEDADCEGDPPCPADATLGCVCVPGPTGGACVPACEADEDCPEIPGVEKICLPQGFCSVSETDPVCGDGICTGSETKETCPKDCGDAESPIPCSEAPPGKDCCGDDVCNGPETDENCPEDCEDAEPICGDDLCTLPETKETCPEDCQETFPEPTLCATDTDCEAEGACPAGASMGCLCAPVPGGDAFCAPICTTDEDCPAAPEGFEMVCKLSGFCVS